MHRKFLLFGVGIIVLGTALAAGLTLSSMSDGDNATLRHVRANEATTTTMAEAPPSSTEATLVPNNSAADTDQALALTLYTFFGTQAIFQPLAVSSIEVVQTTYQRASSLFGTSWRPDGVGGVTAETTTWVVEAIGTFESYSPGAMRQCGPPFHAAAQVVVQGVPGTSPYELAEPVSLSSAGSPETVPESEWQQYIKQLGCPA